MGRILLFTLFIFSWSLQLPAQSYQKYRSYQRGKTSKKYAKKKRRKVNRGVNRRSPASFKPARNPSTSNTSKQKVFTQFDKSPHPHYDKFMQMSSDDQLKVLVMFMKMYGMLEGMTKYKKMYPKNKLKQHKTKQKKRKKTVKLILDLLFGEEAIAQSGLPETLDTSQLEARFDDDKCYYAGWESYYVRTSPDSNSGKCTKPTWIKSHESKMSGRREKDYFNKNQQTPYENELSNAKSFYKYVINPSTGKGEWKKDNKCKEVEDTRSTNGYVDYILCNPAIYGESTNKRMLCVPAGTEFSANSSAQCHDGFLKAHLETKDQNPADPELDFMAGIKKRLETEEGKKNYEELVSRLFLTCYCGDKSFYNSTTNNSGCKGKDCTYVDRTQFHSTCFGLMGQFYALHNIDSAACADYATGNEPRKALVRGIRDPLKELFGKWNSADDYKINWSKKAQEKNKNQKYDHWMDFEKYKTNLKKIIDNDNKGYQKYYCKGGKLPEQDPDPVPTSKKACLCSKIDKAGDLPQSAKLICVPEDEEDGYEHDNKECLVNVCKCNPSTPDTQTTPVTSGTEASTAETATESTLVIDETATAETETKQDCVEDAKITELAQLIGLQENLFKHNQDQCADPGEPDTGKKELCYCPKQDTDSATTESCVTKNNEKEHPDIKAGYEEAQNQNNDLQFEKYLEDNWNLLEANADKCQKKDDDKEDNLQQNYSVFICFKTTEEKTKIYAYITTPSQKADEAASIADKNAKAAIPNGYKITLNSSDSSSSEESFTEESEEEAEAAVSAELEAYLNEKFPEYSTKQEIKDERDKISVDDKKDEKEAELKAKNEEILTKFKNRTIELKKVNQKTLEDYMKLTEEEKLKYECTTGSDPHETFDQFEKNKTFQATLKVGKDEVKSNEILRQDQNATQNQNLNPQGGAGAIGVGDNYLPGRD